MNNIGNHNVRNIDAMLDSHAIWPFTQVAQLGWTKEQVAWLTAAAKMEARDVNLKLYMELSVCLALFCNDPDSEPRYVAWGRKR